MSFRDLTRQRKGGSFADCVRLTCSETKSGKLTLRLVIGANIAADMKLAPGPMAVQLGEGEAGGQLRVAAHAKGPFKAYMMRSAFILQLGEQSFAPERAGPATECLVRKKDAGELVVELPEWCWLEDQDEAPAGAEGQAV